MKTKIWWQASVDYLRGFGQGFFTKNFYIKAVSRRTARAKIKAYIEKRYGSLYDLGSDGNRGVNCLEPLHV